MQVYTLLIYCFKLKKNAKLCFQNNGVITDFVSFYTLPSTVMHHPVHKSLKAAYSFYNVSTVTPWVDLMQDALIIAKNVSWIDFSFYMKYKKGHC